MRTSIVVVALALLSTTAGCSGVATYPNHTPATELHISLPPGSSTAQIVSTIEAVRPEIVQVISKHSFFAHPSDWGLGIVRAGFHLGVLDGPLLLRVLDFPWKLLTGWVDWSYSSGSGFFITRDLVVTNAHVVDNTSQLLVCLTDGRKALATVEQVDSERDLALLRVQGLQGAAPQGLLLRLNGCAQGEQTLAMGFPYRGQELDVGATYTPPLTVTGGLVTRSTMRLNDNASVLLETDAALNPGMSGGPLISRLDGKVLGVIVAKLEGEGQGLVISARMILDAFPRLSSP